MNKTLKKITTTTIIFLLLFMGITIPVFPARDIENSNIEKVVDTTYYDTTPGCINSSNGTWIVGYSKGYTHSDNKYLMCTRSFDFGETWTTPVQIQPNTQRQDQTEMVLADNGTIVWAYRHTNNDDCQYMVSHDNGSTWIDKGDFDGGTSTVFAVSGFEKVGSTLFACGYQLTGGNGDGDHNCSLWVSTDNGISWSVRSWINQDRANDEWHFIALNSTHFLAAFRYFPDEVANYSYFAESFDAGYTWTNFEDRSDEFNNGFLQTLKFSWLDANDNIILLSTRWGNAAFTQWKFSYFVSDDLGQTWSNWTNLSTGVRGQIDLAEACVIQEPSRNYVMFYNGTKTTAPSATVPDIYGMWVFDNTTTSNTSDNPYFLDINEYSNGSTLTDTYRWGNLTKYLSSDYSGTASFNKVEAYEIRIANTSAFTSPFANITGINDTYAGTYIEDVSSWYFKTDQTIRYYGGGYGTHYYQARAKIRVVTN